MTPTDSYGIPENFFGLVSDEFYGLVGRLVMLATLLEDHILGLLWQMDSVAQPVHAGKSASTIVRLCREQLDRLEPSFRDEVAQFLDQADEALKYRNAIVHSLWADPDPDDMYGWRNIVKGRRRTPEEWTVWTRTSHQELRERIQGMGRLIRKCKVLQVQAHARLMKSS